MTNYFQCILPFVALFLAILGIILVSKAYSSKPSAGSETKEKRIILTGVWGIFLLFLSGLIIIYFYSIEPISERILDEKDKIELPDLGMRV